MDIELGNRGKLRQWRSPAAAAAATREGDVRLAHRGS